MNNFCIDLNLSIDPLCVDVNTLPKLNYNKLDQKKYINPELIDFFKSMSLEIEHVATFFTPKNFQFSKIHIDNSGYKYSTYPNNQAKINWIYGGKDSLMNWYKLKPGSKLFHKPILGFKQQDSYIDCNKEDVDLIHSQAVNFPSIVHVGIPHNITNYNEPRLCLTMVIKDTYSNTRLSFDQLVGVFYNYIGPSGESRTHIGQLSVAHGI